jgi:hypothetical protein
VTALFALAPLAAAAIAAAAILSWRGRPYVRAVLRFLAVLSLPIAVGVLIAVYGRSEAGTWLLLVPLTFAWLAIFDWKYGIGARLARPPRAKQRQNGPTAAPPADR